MFTGKERDFLERENKGARLGAGYKRLKKNSVIKLMYSFLQTMNNYQSYFTTKWILSFVFSKVNSGNSI